MTDSLSRRLGRWVAGLHYDDLPDTVVDRASGVTLQALASALLGSQRPNGASCVSMITESEQGVQRGASILTTGQTATVGGAAFANSQLVSVGGKWDTFKMLLHPGTCVIPAALAVAQDLGATGQEYVTAVSAGYEVLERLSADVIPALAARGFNPHPVFGVFGAAVAAAKLQGLDEDQAAATIGFCVNLAAGNFESAMHGGMSMPGAAVRDGLTAASAGRAGLVSGETNLEGPAGFFHSYLGNSRGDLQYSFDGTTHTDLDRIGEDLGDRWLMLETIYRIYSISGYNLAHVEVTGQLCRDEGIEVSDIQSIEAVVNWLETRFPSPVFHGRREDLDHSPGSTAYHVAYGAVMRSFPVTRGWAPQSAGPDDPPEIAELAQRVTITPSTTAGLFAPRITITTKDGRVHARQATGMEFAWDFDEQASRIHDLRRVVPIPDTQFDTLVSSCRDLTQLSSIDGLVDLTRIP